MRQWANHCLTVSLSHWPTSAAVHECFVQKLVGKTAVESGTWLLVDDRMSFSQRTTQLGVVPEPRSKSHF